MNKQELIDEIVKTKLASRIAKDCFFQDAMSHILNTAQQLDEPSEARECEIINHQCKSCGHYFGLQEEKYDEFCGGCGFHIKGRQNPSEERGEPCGTK